MTASTKAFFLVGLVLAATLVSSFALLADATANGEKITGPLNDEKSRRQIRHGPSHDDYYPPRYGDPPHKKNDSN